MLSLNAVKTLFINKVLVEQSGYMKLGLKVLYPSDNTGGVLSIIENDLSSINTFSNLSYSQTTQSP